MAKMIEKKQILIAGPCAIESEAQIMESSGVVSRLELPSTVRKELRAMIYKPRTGVDWDGVGEIAIPWLVTVTKDIPIAVEVLLPHQADKLVDEILRHNPHAKIRLWLGARNYNHLVQQHVGELAAANQQNITVLQKNPMYEDAKAWLGAADHILHAGMPHENLILCHRGHSPNGHPNPRGLRNLPNHEFAMRIKEKSQLEMLFDPSHTAGQRQLVTVMLQEAAQFPYDGVSIEAHPDPDHAKTDLEQQIPLEQLQAVLVINWLNLIK